MEMHMDIDWRKNQLWQIVRRMPEYKKDYKKIHQICNELDILGNKYQKELYDIYRERFELKYGIYPTKPTSKNLPNFPWFSSYEYDREKGRFIIYVYPETRFTDIKKTYWDIKKEMKFIETRTKIIKEKYSVWLNKSLCEFVGKVQRIKKPILDEYLELWDKYYSKKKINFEDMVKIVYESKGNIVDDDNLEGFISKARKGIKRINKIMDLVRNKNIDVFATSRRIEFLKQQSSN